MPVEYPKELEVQRIENITSGFGWTKIKEEVVGQDLIVTFKKKLLTEAEVGSPPVPS